MAPTNNKTVHQTSFTPYREQPRSTRIVVAYPRPAFSATNRTNTFQPVLINNNSKFFKDTHRTKIRKNEIPRSMATIELPSAFAESRAYPPDRELPGSPRQCSLPLACRHPPGGHQIGARKRAQLKTPSSANHTAAASQLTGRIAKAASWLHLLRVSPAHHPLERPSHTHTPIPSFGGRGHEAIQELKSWERDKVKFNHCGCCCCYCVCVFSSHPFWTSSSLDVPAGVAQEEGHTGFLIHLPSAVRALIFVARRIQPFLSLVDREVEFCVLTIVRLMID